VTDVRNFHQETLTEHKMNFVKGNHSDLIDAYLDEIENKQDTSGSVNFHGRSQSKA
jgi:metallophosphoesterase superfamily enzyme